MEESKLVDQDNQLEVYAKGSPKISNLNKQELKSFLTFLELEIRDHYRNLNSKEPP